MANLKNTAIDDTGYLRLPSGTSTQRPSSPVNGMTRYNTDFGFVEIYSSGSWRPTRQFFDNFETFSGWTTYGSGSVTQSSTQKYQGSFSAYKTTAGDPSGAFKLLNESVYRNYTVECWLFSEEPRVGGAADRVSIVNSSGNGYGLNFQPTTLAVEIRNTWNGTSLSFSSWTRPANTWYRAVFTAFPDGSFTLFAYNTSGSLLGSHYVAGNTTHGGPFDRVAILGGFNYYVDNLRVIKNG